jgi:hypothetical protein
MSQPTVDAKAVVRAVEGLTTQVRRVADALTTPVVETADAPTTCDASTLGAFDRHLGPCVLRRGHDGPVHRGPEGETWATVVAAVGDGPRCVSCGSAEVRYRNYLEQPFCWPCANGEQQAPAADEDTQPAPNMLRVLADRAARGVLTPDEGLALRRRVEQVINGRETWKAKAEEIERDRDRADTIRAEVQRDRDQHAAVLADVLSRFTNAPGVGHQCLTNVPDKVFEHWRSVVAPTAERPWWETVRIVRTELEEAQAAIERVRSQATHQRARGASGSTDHKIGLYDAAVAILAALDGTEQPTTEQE